MLIRFSVSLLFRLISLYFLFHFYKNTFFLHFFMKIFGGSKYFLYLCSGFSNKSQTKRKQKRNKTDRKDKQKFSNIKIKYQKNNIFMKTTKFPLICTTILSLVICASVWYEWSKAGCGIGSLIIGCLFDGGFPFVVYAVFYLTKKEHEQL